MAGKKGRSGRKPKIKIEKPESKATTAAPAPQKPIIPPTDPGNLNRIEAELRQTMAESQPQTSPGAAPGQPSEPRKPPERIIRLAWKWIYGAEDAWARASLGIGAQYKGLFADEKLIEAHVEPTCEVIEKYVPVEYWNALDEKMPIVMLFAAIAECQMSIFEKINQIKMENGGKKPAGGKTGNPNDQYPTVDQVRT